MYKTKVFMGTVNKGEGADDKFNLWIKTHPNIEIIEFKYQQARYGDHSICMLYKEI